MLMDQDTQWLYQLLAEVQLEKFYLRVRDGLNITRVEHFAYVKESDLEHIGISKPGEPRYRRVLSDGDGFLKFCSSQDKDGLRLSPVDPQWRVCLWKATNQPSGFTTSMD